MPQPLQVTLNCEHPDEAAVGISELLSVAVKNSGISRLEISWNMKCHPSFVTKILKPENKNNVSVGTIAKVVAAIGGKLTIQIELPNVPEKPFNNEGAGI